ncbi:MAG: hypothetical protein ABW128_04790 [Rhizorhabdus sp.]
MEKSLDELRAVLEEALAQADALGRGAVAAIIVHAIDILDNDERGRR